MWLSSLTFLLSYSFLETKNIALRFVLFMPSDVAIV